MKSVTLSQLAPRTNAEYKAAIDELLAEMRQMNERMEDRRVNIERLDAETQALKTQTRAILAGLGKRP